MESGVRLLPTEDHGRPPGGDPLARIRATLEEAGQRFTRQRETLARLLYGIKGNHFTAEMLLEAALGANVGLSVATVYNTLALFCELGLLQKIAVDGSKTYYDTNVTTHQHFYVEDSHELLDIAVNDLVLSPVESIPEGYVVSRIDIVVRIRKRKHRAYSPCDAAEATAAGCT
jgi:Fur family transcriptional regulator, iron response regulator